MDHISGGRLIFGVGRSGLPRTYEDYGVSYAESRDRFAEVLAQTPRVLGSRVTISERGRVQIVPSEAAMLS